MANKDTGADGVEVSLYVYQCPSCGDGFLELHAMKSHATQAHPRSKSVNRGNQ